MKAWVCSDLDLKLYADDGAIVNQIKNVGAATERIGRGKDSR